MKVTAFIIIMTIASVVAQIAQDNQTALLTYGPLGLITGWFMWRFEKWSLKMVSEFRGMKHAFVGLESALLVEASTRPGCPVVIKDYAEKRIAKLERGGQGNEALDDTLGAD